MIEEPPPHRQVHDASAVLIFDVNETLLDIEWLNPHFERMFGDRAVMRTWFGELVMYSMTLTLSGHYVDFFTLGRAVLQMVAATREVVLADEDVNALGEAMSAMPAHPDVVPGLQQLAAGGYRLVTLTNSPHRPDSPSPLDNAGLCEFFQRQFTVDTAGLFKPSTDLYRRVAAELQVAVSDCVMVAAHAWDTIGAQGAGMRSALITRPGNAPLTAPGVPQPTMIVASITELAGRLAEERASP